MAKALRNSFYGAAEEFAKLPPIVQRLVGAPAQLKEWAAMDTKTVQSVVASNFQRSYQTRVKSDKEFQALPPAIREFVTSLTSGDNPAIKRLED